MRFYDNGAFYSVSVSPRELREFAERWPCSGMRNPSRGMWFQFDKRNGDLVDIKGERASYDGSAVSALSQDAQSWAQRFLTCTNCGGPLPEGHGTHDKSGKHRFCDTCAGISEALGIGMRQPAFLYESTKPGPIPSLNAATSWTGAVMGYVIGRTVPFHNRGPNATRQRFAPIRFRVRMLDGSLWHGTGPSSNGNYIRLRPMKGA